MKKELETKLLNINKISHSIFKDGEIILQTSNDDILAFDFHIDHLDIDFYKQPAQNESIELYEDDDSGETKSWRVVKNKKINLDRLNSLISFLKENQLFENFCYRLDKMLIDKI